MAAVGELPVHLPLLVQEIVAGGGRRGRFTVVDEHLALVPGEVDQHESPAGQVAGPGVGHRQGEAGGHRGIHRVAPLLQDPASHLRRQLFGGHHHALAGDGGQEPLTVIDDRRRLVPGLAAGGRGGGEHEAAQGQGQQRQ